MNDGGKKRGLEPNAGPEGEEGGDITRRFIEALSDDTAELLDKIAEENDVPNCDMIDAHIEPEDVRIPSGQDLDKEAVIAARRCEMRPSSGYAKRTLTHLVGGSTPAGRTLPRTTRGSRRCAAGGCCRRLRRTSRTTTLRQLRRRRATGSST